MTSQPRACTEDSIPIPVDKPSLGIGTIDFLPSIHLEGLPYPPTNDDDMTPVTETSPLSTEQAGQKTPLASSSSNVNVSNPNAPVAEKKRKPFCHKYWEKILIFILMVLMFALIVWNRFEISKPKVAKSVMLYRPTVEFLKNDERPDIMKWRLVEEHSENPFTQINSTHLHVKEDGFYHISCSLLMETNNNHTNVITLLIFYSNKEGSIYTKKTLPKGFSRFSLKQSIVLHLLRGDYFCVEVIPAQYLMKDPDGSYLSIVQK